MYLKRKLKLLAVMTGVIVFAVVILFAFTGATTKPDNEDKIFLPIIMYHSLLDDVKLQNDYIISPSIFENDLKYLKEKGYTTITVSELEEYVYCDKPLPEKCIMLTFDDGNYNNYYYAYPLLNKYGAKIVFSPIVSMIEKFTDEKEISLYYGYTDINEIKEMIKSGLVEVQNHSYNMHSLMPRKGIGMNKGETDESYISVISDDILKAQNYLEKNLGVSPNCFVYPYGEKNKLALTVIKKLGFISTMTCTEKPNFITKNPDSLYELGRYRRDSGESIEKLMQRIIKDGNLK
ncbi:MAG: polysaccharide deacetylase family protein [Ruminococcus sp.]|nr:polysaccharide deacetylase family protein [Ruminococcus sp.]